MANKSTTTISSNRPNIPNTASGIISNGEIRYRIAAKKQMITRKRNMQNRPLNEKKSLVKCLNIVGRSYR